MPNRTISYRLRELANDVDVIFRARPPSAHLLDLADDVRLLEAEAKRSRANIESCERCGADRLVSGTENPCPCTFAAGPWQDGEPPRDRTILGLRNGSVQITWWAVDREGVGRWYVDAKRFYMLPPERWAEISVPDEKEGE